MKNMLRSLLGLTVLSASALAGEKPSDLERLVRLELDLGLMQASGFGEKHPQILKLAANIQRIETRNPGIRDKAYVSLLMNNRNRLEEEQSEAIDEGIGERHPQRLELARQLALIDRRIKAVK